MRMLPHILLSVAVAAVAILVYDQVRVDKESQPPTPSHDRALLERVARLEDRLDSLSEPGSEPPPAPAMDADLLARLERLEARLTSAHPDAEMVPAETASTDAIEKTPASKAAGAPTPEDIEEFRKLAGAARKQELAKRSGRLVDVTLEKLGMALTGEQRDRLVEAYIGFRSRRNEIWAEAKARGGRQGSAANWDAVIAETNGVIEREFTERISTFLRISDAETISAGLNSSGK